MKRAQRIAAFAGVAIVAAAAGMYVHEWNVRNSPLPFARLSAPKSVPELKLADASGRARTLADFRGKVVLLNIWATWCAPCREEMPALDRVQQKLGGPGFEVLALSIDTGGAPAVKRFYDEIGVRSLAVYADPTMRATAALGAMGVPTTLLIDEQGREIGRHTGPAQWDGPEVVQKIERHLNGGRKS